MATQQNNELFKTPEFDLFRQGSLANGFNGKRFEELTPEEKTAFEENIKQHWLKFTEPNRIEQEIFEVRHALEKERGLYMRGTDEHANWRDNLKKSQNQVDSIILKHADQELENGQRSPNNIFYAMLKMRDIKKKYANGIPLSRNVEDGLYDRCFEQMRQGGNPVVKKLVPTLFFMQRTAGIFKDAARGAFNWVKSLGKRYSTTYSNTIAVHNSSLLNQNSPYSKFLNGQYDNPQPQNNIPQERVNEIAEAAFLANEIERLKQQLRDLQNSGAVIEATDGRGNYANSNGELKQDYTQVDTRNDRGNYDRGEYDATQTNNLDLNLDKSSNKYKNLTIAELIGLELNKSANLINDAQIKQWLKEKGYDDKLLDKISQNTKTFDNTYKKEFEADPKIIKKIFDKVNQKEEPKKEEPKKEEPKKEEPKKEEPKKEEPKFTFTKEEIQKYRENYNSKDAYNLNYKIVTTMLELKSRERKSIDTLLNRNLPIDEKISLLNGLDQLAKQISENKNGKYNSILHSQYDETKDNNHCNVYTFSKQGETAINKTFEQLGMKDPSIKDAALSYLEGRINMYDVLDPKKNKEFAKISKLYNDEKFINYYREQLPDLLPEKDRKKSFPHAYNFFTKRMSIDGFPNEFNRVCNNAIYSEIYKENAKHEIKIKPKKLGFFGEKKEEHVYINKEEVDNLYKSKLEYMNSDEGKKRDFEKLNSNKIFEYLNEIKNENKKQKQEVVQNENNKSKQNDEPEFI